MIRALLLMLALTPSARADCVVLLHGLQASARTMAPMAQHLAEAGFVTFNGGYPSTQARIETLADYILPKALNHCPKHGKIHVVAHSMGGLLLRSWQDQSDRIGRVVLIATPNEGSELSNILAFWPFLSNVAGPAGRQITTHENGLPRQLPEPKGEVGVILGTRSRSWLYSTLIKGVDDGRVAVTSALTPAAKDTIAVPLDHNSLPLHPAVIAEVTAFLKTGLFKKSFARERPAR